MKIDPSGGLSILIMLSVRVADVIVAIVALSIAIFLYFPRPKVQHAVLGPLSSESMTLISSFTN